MYQYYMKCIMAMSLAFGLLSACNVFFEEDIEADKVKIIAPADGTSTEIVTHTFWWEHMAGADGYRLQVVTPDFKSAETLIVDTLVSADKFELTLYAGDFQWRLQAQNTAYETEWTYANLKIFSSDDLKRQTIRLRKPFDNYFMKESTVLFQWDTIPYVDKYELRVYKGGWEQTLLVDSLNIDPKKNTLSLSKFDENELWWGIRAINEKSETRFNTQRLVIDQTKPNQPKLLKPGNNVSLTDTTVTFTWESADPQWKTVIDSVIIFEKRSVLGDKLVYEGVSDQKSLTKKLNNNITYKWLVKSVDQAGNESMVSEVREFKVDQ